MSIHHETPYSEADFQRAEVKLAKAGIPGGMDPVLEVARSLGWTAEEAADLVIMCFAIRGTKRTSDTEATE